MWKFWIKYYDDNKKLEYLSSNYETIRFWIIDDNIVENFEHEQIDENIFDEDEKIYSLSSNVKFV